MRWSPTKNASTKPRVGPAKGIRAMKPLSIPSRNGCGTPATMRPTVMSAPLRKQISRRPRKKFARTAPISSAMRVTRSRSFLGMCVWTNPWIRSSSKSRK